MKTIIKNIIQIKDIIGIHAFVHPPFGKSTEFSHVMSEKTKEH